MDNSKTEREILKTIKRIISSLYLFCDLLDSDDYKLVYIGRDMRKSLTFPREQYKLIYKKKVILEISIEDDAIIFPSISITTKANPDYINS